MSKVRKLIALGNSPSEAEARTALEKAQVLLARYGMDIGDLGPTDKDINEGVVLVKSRLRVWESYLIAVIAASTFTSPLQVRDDSGSRMILVGRTVNIRAALDMFDYLHRVVLVLGRSERRRVAHVESFRTGIVHRLGERLLNKDPPAPTDDTRALVVQMGAQAEKENRGYINERYGSTITRLVGRKVNADSYQKGLAVGDLVSLNKQIASHP